MINELTVTQREEASPEWLRHWVCALVFIFPITVATIGWGSVIFGLLLLPALYYGRGWKKLSAGEQRIMAGYVLLLLAMALSMVNAEDLKESGQMLERFLRFSMIVPIYLMFRRYRFTMGRELAAGAFFACLVMAIQAVYEVMWQGESVVSGHYNKIVFGDLAMWWAAVIAVAAVTVMKHWWQRVFIVAAILLALYASVLAQARGAWLFVPLIPVILFWSWGIWLKKTRLWVVIGLVAIFTLVGVTLLQSDKIMGSIEQGITNVEQFTKDPAKRNSWGIRLNLWRNAFLVFKEHPVLGSGTGDFSLEMKRLVDDSRSWSPHVVEFSHAHNIYFDTMARAGLVGLAAMILATLLLPLAFFYRGVRREVEPWARFYAAGGVMLIAAFATFGLSEGLWLRNPFINTYVIALVVFMAGLVNHREASAPTPRRDETLDKVREQPEVA